MARLKGFLIILLCNLAGNLVITLIGLPFPGSVLGMLLLLGLLLGRAVKLETVESTANLLISLMMLFILPGAVNMMNVFDKFTGIIVQLLVIATAASVLTLISSALVADKLALLINRDKKTEDAA